MLPAFRFRFGVYVLLDLIRLKSPSYERSGHEEENRIVVERLTN